MSASFEEVPIYYILQPGEEKERGPYSFKQMAEMWRAGEITAETLFAVQGMDEWKPLSILQDRLTGKADIRESPKAPPKLENERRTRGNKMARLPSGLGLAGLLLLVLGTIGMMGFVFLYDTATSSGHGERMYNIGLLNERLVGVTGSGVLMLMGIVCITAQCIRATILETTLMQLNDK
jgi:hypothetical protein